MNKKSGIRRTVEPPVAGSVTGVLSSERTPSGQEIWHVTSGGKKATIVTSATSVTTMDEAAVLYVGALERLAKR